MIRSRAGFRLFGASLIQKKQKIFVFDKGCLSKVNQKFLSKKSEYLIDSLSAIKLEKFS